MKLWKRENQILEEENNIMQEGKQNSGKKKIKLCKS